MSKQIGSLIGQGKYSQRQKIMALLISANPDLKQSAIKGLTCQSQFYYEINNLHIRHFCTKCQKSLHKTTRITLNGDNLCIPCFSQNQNITQGLVEEYTVNSHWYFPIIEQSWPAQHQVLLLEGIQKNGFGNWQEIRQYIQYYGAHYSADQLEYHYDKFYLQNQNFCPTFCQNLITMEIMNPCLLTITDRQQLPVPIPVLLPTTQLTTATITRTTKQRQKLKTIKNTIKRQSHIKQTNQKQICYNEKRNQFFTVYNDKLQKYIADLQFRDNDSPEECQIKMRILQAYNRGLEDRYHKQQMIIQHKLLCPQYLVQREQLFLDDPYLIHANILVKPFMRYNSLQQQQNLLSSVSFCLKLQGMIKAIQLIKKQRRQTNLKSLNNEQNKTNIQHQIVHNDCDPQLMSQPRKRVHKDPLPQIAKLQQLQAQQKDQNRILSNIGITTYQLNQYLHNLKTTSNNIQNSYQPNILSIIQHIPSIQQIKHAQIIRTQSAYYQNSDKLSNKFKQLGIKVTKLKKQFI